MNRYNKLKLKALLSLHLQAESGSSKVKLQRNLKSENAVRCFALSPRLLAHIADFLKRWQPNERGLLFATRNGTPWDANLLGKRKLYSLLDSLGIERGGLHAFRHTNSTLMDRLGVPLKVRTVILRSRWALTRTLRARMMNGLRSSWTEFCAQMRPKKETAQREHSLGNQLRMIAGVRFELTTFGL
jgi:hypothetical protein